MPRLPLPQPLPPGAHRLRRDPFAEVRRLRNERVPDLLATRTEESREGLTAPPVQHGEPRPDSELCVRTIMICHAIFWLLLLA